MLLSIIKNLLLTIISNIDAGNSNIIEKEAIELIDILKHYTDTTQYISLYKSWFGDNVDCKIIESAIVFWFMDDDYLYEKKVEKFYMN